MVLTFLLILTSFLLLYSSFFVLYDFLCTTIGLHHVRSATGGILKPLLLEICIMYTLQTHGLLLQMFCRHFGFLLGCDCDGLLLVSLKSRSLI